MSKLSTNRRSLRSVGTQGQGASKASAESPALADLVRDVHRQLDASRPSKGRGRSGSTLLSPPLLAVIANILDEKREDAGESPKVQAA